MKREASVDDILRLASRAPGPAPTESLDIVVLAGLLVELHEHSGELDLKLFGRLDGGSARLLESSLLARLRTSALLDLTNLDAIEPAALRRLTDHQREALRAGRQLLLRIAPHQASELSQPEP
jgi:ABC-type transporter Mla MlaB component